MSNSTRCAACRFLRRRCRQDCVLAPYFPPTNPQRFANVHKVFGASKITELLKQLPVHLRYDAAECMSIEAASRARDPVYGCVGVISQLQQHVIDVQSELVKIKGELAVHNAQQQLQLENGERASEQQQDELLWLGSTQHDPLNLDQLLIQANDYQKSHF
ncbi:LOB domain-containing protein 24-like [Populus alba x Populus x berolinensis]|uniref:LOB domain-containing protein 24-like n=1 Tax=Populus alba x Populus x berolinensis TaxID=444605 RepID=A0AAD6Q928_9ROSI|nr:LOB domain-containing protein 24-like [Populus alba x Populus x berolinensis]